MNVFGKDFKEIKYEDIVKLKNNGTPESSTIEYKLKWENNENGKKEILKDISSFANTSGGIIIVGVSENDDSTINEIIGIDNSDDEEQRIINICNARIKERILGLDLRRINNPSSEGKDLLIVYIPKSLKSPHFIEYDNNYQIYRRYGTHTNKCSVEEIKEMCLKSEFFIENITKYKERLINKLSTEYNDKTIHSLISIPLDIKENIIDIKDEKIGNLLINCNFVNHAGLRVYKIFLKEKSFTINGIRYGTLLNNYLDIYRNGTIVLNYNLNKFNIVSGLTDARLGSIKCINGEYLTESTINFLILCNTVYSYFSFHESYLFMDNFYFINGIYLSGSKLNSMRYYESFTYEKCKEENIKLPEIVIYPDSNIEKEVKKLMDVFYNAFGHKECPLFDENGKYIKS